ncbi:6-bladed beta-propeller [Rhodocaloribacter litoris]|uniref:6-bladed beta-propeller n=1 Tax=Rhodocaloribacter litoris TaxID=2558931 RepID=UPI001E63C3EC|nr:6-bladed beta-propeller [Rhodocaloribacter litoris]
MVSLRAFYIACWLSLVILSGCSDAARGLVEVQQPSQQPVRERKILGTLKDLYEYVGIVADTNQVYNAQALSLNPDGGIFVLDAGDHKIKEFSAEGKLIRSYGNGKGRGPGEFIKPVHFMVDSLGAVWVADTGDRKLVRFRADGSLSETYFFEDEPRAIAMTGRGRVASLSFPDSTLFKLYDLPANGDEIVEVQKFGTLVENQFFSSIALAGTIDASPDGDYFVYAGLYGGRIASFSPEGMLRFYVETIDGTPFPPVVKFEEDAYTIDRKGGNRISQVIATVSPEDIYIVCTRWDDSNMDVFIDVYDSADGMYQYSIRYDLPCKPLLLTDTLFFVSCDGYVHKWRRLGRPGVGTVLLGSPSLP